MWHFIDTYIIANQEHTTCRCLCSTLSYLFIYLPVLQGIRRALSLNLSPLLEVADSLSFHVTRLTYMTLHAWWQLASQAPLPLPLHLSLLVSFSSQSLIALKLPHPFGSICVSPVCLVLFLMRSLLDNRICHATFAVRCTSDLLHIAIFFSHSYSHLHSHCRCLIWFFILHCA